MQSRIFAPRHWSNLTQWCKNATRDWVRRVQSRPLPPGGGAASPDSTAARVLLGNERPVSKRNGGRGVSDWPNARKVTRVVTDSMNPVPAPVSLLSNASDEPARAPESRVLSLPGQFLGPYRLIFELASGGMASIYVALAERRTGAHRIVAVKRLHPHLADDPNFRTMFLDEASIASRIRHPNVCAVFDYGEHDSTPYIVMEYIAGEPVSAIWSALPRDGSALEKWRWASLAARIVADTCEALHAAHELHSIDGQPLNVVHRDVSPENLLVTYDGVVKLCDFGIAIAEKQEHSTEAGMLKGKYAYIQPEVLRGERPDRRSDIWSLGVVLWELMTGERLFRRESALETIRAVGEALVPAPSAVTGVAPELDAVVLQALAADPNERFSTAREFGTALNSALARAGRHASLGDVADWMGELFPGGRAKKEQLVELVATLYEPVVSPKTGTIDRHSGDCTETATIAIRAASETIMPDTPFKRASLPSFAFAEALPIRPDDSSTRWRRPLSTFVLGGLLAIVLSPSKRNEHDDRAREPAAIATAIPARHMVLPVTDAPQRERLPRDVVQYPPEPARAAFGVADPQVLDPGEAESLADSRASCDVKLAIGDGRWEGPAESPTAARSSERTRAERGRDGPRAWSARGAAILDMRAPRPAIGAPPMTSIPPVRSLELAPDFVAYTPMNLFPPALVVSSQRRAQSEFSGDSIPLRQVQIPASSSRFSVARRGPEP